MTHRTHPAARAFTATSLDQVLAALVTQWQARPFAWGTTDCCQFARAAAWEVHGVVVESPAYDSERSARRVLDSLGGYAGLLLRAGFHARPLTAAARGDFVVFEHKGPGLFAHGLALVTGPQAHAPTRLGLVAINASAWLQCWGPDPLLPTTTTTTTAEVAHA